MNKTISMNVGGIVFYIDEDAFEKLSAYLLSIKKNLGTMVGSEEIIADVEARTAELFQERLKKVGRQAVSREDVKSIIDILGQPEDYVDEETASSGDSHHKARTRHPIRKLYRDPEHKTIAGVASGLAAYSGIHTAWVRILFVVLCFITSGSTLILYALLWICVPYARTTSEKLEMRGEPVNFDSIKRNFKDTTAQLKAKLNENPTLFEKLLSDTGKLLRIILKVIGYFALLVLLLAAAITIGAGLLSALGMLSWGWNMADIGSVFGSSSNYLFLNDAHHHMLLLIIPILMAILLIGLIVVILRMTNEKKPGGQPANTGLLSLFILLFFMLLLWHVCY